MHILILASLTGRIRIVERERADPDRDGEGLGEGLRILRDTCDGEPTADFAVEERRAARAERDRRERDRGGNPLTVLPSLVKLISKIAARRGHWRCL
jgi:hypothetical protein